MFVSGVLDTVVDDLRVDFPTSACVRPWWGREGVRFVDEMTTIAATQADAGLGGELFIAMAGVYARLAETRWGRTALADLPDAPAVTGLC